MGDKGYASNKVRPLLLEQGIIPCIRPGRHRDIESSLQQEGVQHGP